MQDRDWIREEEDAFLWAWAGFSCIYKRHKSGVVGGMSPESGAVLSNVITAVLIEAGSVFEVQ